MPDFSTREDYERWKAQLGIITPDLPQEQPPPPPEAPARVRQVGDRIVVNPPLPPETTKVVITGIQIPFGSLVMFIVQFSLATIPAAFVLFMLGVFLVVLLSAMGITFQGLGK